MTAILLPLFSVAALAQVSMISSPVNGNGVDIGLSWWWTNTNITLTMSVIPGQIQDSCYINLLPNQLGSGYVITLYDTTGGSPESPQSGVTGTPGGALSNSICSVDLSASSGNAYNGVLRLTMNPLRVGTRQIVASYANWICDSYDSPSPCWYDWVTDTVGVWNSAPNAGPTAILTQPAPDARLTVTSSQFTWTPVANATQYCLELGTSPTSANLYSNCGPALGTTSSVNLPTTGIPVNVTITATVPGQAAAVSQFTIIAANYNSPRTVASPTSTILSGTSLSITLTGGVNVLATTATVITNAGQNLGQFFTPTFTANIPTDANQVSLAITSTFLNKEIVTVSKVFNRLATPADPDPHFDPSQPNTIRWDSRPGTTYYYLTAGKVPGSNQIFPGENLDVMTRGAAFTETSKTIPNLSSYQDGSPIWVTIFWKDGESDWRSSSKKLETTATGVVSPPPSRQPSAIIRSGTPIPRKGAAFFWDGPTTGAPIYWLTAGSTYRGVDIYNSFNGRLTARLELNAAFIESIPDSVSRLYVTLYTKIDETTWVPVDYEFTPASDSGSGLIPQSFYTCLNTPDNGVSITCSLPAGILGIGNGSPSFSSPPIVVTRSHTTIQGAGTASTANYGRGEFASSTSTALLRMNAGELPSDCQPLILVTGNVTDVHVKNLTIDGNNGSFTDYCTNPNPNPDPDHPTDGPQPDTFDLLFEGFSAGNAPYNASVENVVFQNALSRSILFRNKGIHDILVTKSSFLRAALTGALVAFEGTSYDKLACDSWDWQKDSTLVRNITFDTILFQDSWTGATAFNQGANLTITNSYLTGNYWNPYDQTGGTSFTGPCVKNANFTNSTFDGWGVMTKTQGIELHSKGVTISNNFIRGYAEQGVFIRESQDVTLTDNYIINNGQRGDPAGGVTINALPNGRETQNIVFEHNTVQNLDSILPSTQQVALRIMNCGENCSRPVGPITFVDGVNGIGGVTKGNDFTNNLYANSGRICIDPGAVLGVIVGPSGDQGSLASAVVACGQ